jgi:Fatty acid hydroxylase superfamily
MHSSLKQLAPSRGNLDLYVIHPLEIFLVQYNYWFTLYVMSSFLFEQVHFVSAFGFLLVSGFLDDLSHTRSDLTIGIPWFHGERIIIYDTKNHDVHHRIPLSNYGLNTMFWDVLLFDSYRYVCVCLYVCLLVCFCVEYVSLFCVCACVCVRWLCWCCGQCRSAMC